MKSCTSIGNHLIAAMALVNLAAGCAAGPLTQLNVLGDPGGPAGFEFRDVFWRPAPQADAGVEVIGYGFIGFYNNPMARNYDPRCPTTGRATIRLHGEPQAQGRFALTMLGPSMTLGPGDDEVLSGVAQSVTVENGEGDSRIIRIPATPVQSRNRPGMSLTLGGTIIARPADGSTFERQLKQFNTERGYRDLPHATQPGSR